MGNIIRGFFDKQALSTIMEPSIIEYPFNFREFMTQPKNRSMFLMEKKTNVYTSLYTNIFGKNFNFLNDLVLYGEPVLAYDNNLGWTLCITPNSIINDILRLVGSKTRVDNYYLPIDNTLSIKNQQKQYLLDVLNKEKQNQTITNKQILDTTINNIDYILNYSYVDLDKRDNISYKAFIYYMALDCLKRMEEGQTILCDLPLVYYERVSKPGISEWPHTVWHDNKPYFTYDPYNERLEKLFKSKPALFQKPTRDQLYHVLNCLEFLPSGHITRNFTTAHTSKGTVKFNPSAFKRLKENEARMKFYESFDRQEAFIGTGGGLNGYFGYVFPNNYVIFDKFYTNYQTKYPAKDQAIYAFPADKFMYSLLTKPAIMAISQTDKTIKRINHTGAWQSKIEEIFNGPDVSSVDFDTMMARYNYETGNKLLKK